VGKPKQSEMDQASLVSVFCCFCFFPLTVLSSMIPKKNLLASFAATELHLNIINLL